MVAPGWALWIVRGDEKEEGSWIEENQDLGLNTGLILGLECPQCGTKFTLYYPNNALGIVVKINGSLLALMQGSYMLGLLLKCCAGDSFIKCVFITLHMLTNTISNNNKASL